MRRVNYIKICMIQARVPDHMPMEVGGRIPNGWLKHSSTPSCVKVLQQPVEQSAAPNLWAIFRHAVRCQNSFAASCGSALTSHGLVRAQEVTTCTRLSKWKISDEFRKQHMIKTTLHTLLRLLRCPGRDGPQDFQLPFPRWPNFASAFQP